MSGDGNQGLSLLAYRVTVLVVSLLLVMLVTLPTQIPGYGQIAMNVGLVTVYFWSVYRPDHFPAVTAVTVGLWQDLLAATPLGVNALLFLIVREGIASQYVFFRSRSFAVIWYCLWPVVLLVTVVAWGLHSALNLVLIDPYPVLFHVGLTIGIYPLVAICLERVSKYLLEPHV